MSSIETPLRKITFCQRTLSLLQTSLKVKYDDAVHRKLFRRVITTMAGIVQVLPVFCKLYVLSAREGCVYQKDCARHARENKKNMRTAGL